MSWTRTVTPEQATQPLTGIYEKIRTHSSRGKLSNLWQAWGLDPTGLAASHSLFLLLMQEPSPLTDAQAELIAVVVSATNGCGYCVAHHGPRLAKVLGDEALARAVAIDYREANLVARDRVLLDYAVALTCEPSERKLDDVDRVREYGFDDVAVLKATEITGLYNLVNRVASSLGVELEPDVPAWEFGPQK